MPRKLKPYMAYSRTEGPVEGAILVIAAIAKAAKKLAWGHCPNVYEWTDQAVTLIRDEEVLALADQDKLSAGLPHVIDSPLHCQACGLWGAGLTADDLCCYCNEPPGEELVKAIRG